jgi:hypothetical protein
MKITKNNLHKMFASLDDEQIACLAAELEENPDHVAKRMKEFTSSWSDERKVNARKKSIQLFSDFVKET